MATTSEPAAAKAELLEMLQVPVVAATATSAMVATAAATTAVHPKKTKKEVAKTSSRHSYLFFSSCFPFVLLR